MTERSHSKFQKKVIKRYYDNLDAIGLQRAQELVTELYLSEGKKRAKVWESLAKSLERAGVPAEQIAFANTLATHIGYDWERGRNDMTHHPFMTKFSLGDVRITGTVNGRPFTAQMGRGLARNPLAIRVIHDGTQMDALVMHPRTAELHRLMPYKAPPDMSRFVLSPMPGLLVQVAVQPGQKVQAGERVAVIEAMKMENVLFAAADGVVKEVKARQGESLTVDQAIVEFE